MRRNIGLFALLVCMLTAGCEVYNPNIDPDDFVDAIDNQYLPLTPGTTFTYTGVTVLPPWREKFGMWGD